MSCQIVKLFSFEDKLPSLKNILFADEFITPDPGMIVAFDCLRFNCAFIEN